MVLSISASLFSIIVSCKQLFQPLFSWMSSKSWNRADSCGKVAGSLFLACKASIDPLLRLTIPSTMREKGYSKEEAINRTLQQQVRREVNSLRQAAYVAAAALDALTAAATMVTMSAAPGTRSALSLILLEDMNSLLALSLPLPPRKAHRTSHQRQIDRQNVQKGKEVYAQALMRAMTLVAAAREKESHGPMWLILEQVECKFATRGHPVSLNTKTVNCYVQNDMVGRSPLTRGYKGVIPKAAFNLLVLAVELFIQIKQLNSKLIVWKQLLIVLNELCRIKSDICVKENTLEQVMAAMTVLLDGSFRLWVTQFFEGKTEYHSLLAVEEEGAKFCLSS